VTFREHIAELIKEIVDLRVALHVKQSELDRLLLGDGATASGTKSMADATAISTVTQVTLTERVLRFFAANGRREIGPHELCALLELPPTQEKSLRATMGRLAADGKLRRVNRGRYAAHHASIDGDPNKSVGDVTHRAMNLKP